MPQFSVGEIVRVLPRERIIESLDLDNKLRGCLFMDQMYNYCGKEFKIIKVVKNYYLGTMLKSRFPLYILDGLICNGNNELFNHKCDRCCTFLWHEEWLEKS